ncbi:nucleotidyl transferase AbiEii/AbiGii toxin family protein [Lysinibacillus fusiformis]
MKTISRNVLEHLKKVAAEKGESLEALLGLYFQERLLYRLSVSAYQERFLLKDHLLLYSLTNGAVKSSGEISLVAKQMPEDVSTVKRTFMDICSIQFHEDGIRFLEDELVITMKNEEFQISIPVTLDQTKAYIQVRISFWDSLLSTPKKIVFPSLLEMASPMILAYPTALIIAEKFEKMTSCVAPDCLMKDFYDIYLLSNTQKIEGRLLQEAISETFDNHRTIIEKHHPLFYADMEKTKEWQVYFGPTSLQFEEVIKRLQILLLPIYNVIVEEGEFFKSWDNELYVWQ